MDRTGKRVVVSCGPIPARLDSVKFLTNRFKGGLAVRTAHELANRGHEVTVVAWQYTPIPGDVMAPEPAIVDGKTVAYPGIKEVVRVRDVFEYYDWFVSHATDYDAFVMAAAVANLTPVHPFEGKFPSHNYKVGEEFDIRFMIAPRAIDAVKAINPRACLIGYKLFDCDTDEELVGIARHTLADAKANVIFANTPATAKTRKLAVMADNSVVPCGFDEHVALMDEAIRAEYYRTEVEPLSDGEAADLDVREAMATVAMFEKTFNGFGTVAVPVRGRPGMFATTSRGHRSGAVVVRGVDDATRTVHASGKATLNAPALSAMLDGRDDVIVVHRHEDDPLYDMSVSSMHRNVSVWSMLQYVFPGTVQEVRAVRGLRELADPSRYDVISFKHHGYLKAVPIEAVDWARYHELFPDRYFGIPDSFRRVLDQYAGKRTLEVGGNDSPEGMYSYDPYVRTDKAVNVSWSEVLSGHYDLAFARNAVNYLTLGQVKSLVERSDAFIANTFLSAPDQKVTDVEAAVHAGGEVRHTLRLPNDTVMRHGFHAHTKEDYEWAGLRVVPYGRNSALVVSGIEI